MKKIFMNKGMILLLLMVFSVIILGDITYASQGNIQTPLESSKEVNEPIEPMNEKTVWYYRTVNGRLQRRLWSLTAGEWLTDWEWV